MLGRIIATALLGYLLGSVPFGYLLYQMQRGEDIRSRGSGNIGATNVLRLAGFGAGAATFLLDAGKGYLAAALAGRMAHTPGAAALAALMAVVGHVYPVFLKFHGGKGVATGLGAFLALAPLSTLLSAGVFLAVVLVWRYVSLASMAAAACLPVILLLRGNTSASLLMAAALSAALILYRHGSNMDRLLHKSEPRL